MSLDDQIHLARVRMQAAADQASIRAALDHAIKDMPRDLGRLEEVLGGELDGGSFLMGMMAAAFIIQGVDIVEAARMRPDLFNEYIEKARQR